MNEYFNEAVEVQNPEPDHVTDFRSYLERKFGIADSALQDQHIELFDACLIVTARKHGILPLGDPTEHLRLELIMEGITDPEQQRTILQNFYRNNVDPPMKNT
jgi:hypothetical protein